MSRAIFVLERAVSLVEHMAISGIYCELNPLIGADLLSAADLCNQARAMIEIDVNQRKRTEPLDETRLSMMLKLSACDKCPRAPRLSSRTPSRD